MTELKLRCVEMTRAIRDQILQEEAELSWDERQRRLKDRLLSDPLYRRLFTSAGHAEGEPDAAAVGRPAPPSTTP